MTAVVWPGAVAQAQTRLNQADPSILERALPRPGQPESAPETPIITGPAAHAAPPLEAAPWVAAAIVVDGAPEVPRSAFSSAIVPYIGRNLARDDLAALSRAVADSARKAGFPFASAYVAPQALASGVLHVRLDAGTISAVRVIGAVNALADRILTRALVTGQPVRREALERAILLVGDIPGVSVKTSQLIRQDGFGILLVTIAEDRLSAYAQVDNRGSKEIGPIRTTLLANARGVFQPGDELGLLSSQTPFQPSEFVFVRARYSAPVDADGNVLSASASYGRANPGAALSALNVVGESIDAAVRASTPLVRSRTRSLWANVEFRGLRSDQTLLGSAFRNDRLATLTGSVNGSTAAGGGVLTGEVAMVVGLPIPGVTHEGDARTSRSDGDARFVTWGYALDWARPLARHISLVLSSEAQLASRPLLATMEIGAGGPAFGRAYDYAERTGDDGILGAGELRADAGAVLPGIIDRLQFYGSIDGGYVGNLRDGRGGGALLSTATGLRLGRGRVDGMVELAFPLNADRFDTGNRNPRLSFRLSRVF
ncbi:ShlB/FhaC/HecB family hemolysin secretion/activation protein [Sphingomonas sp. TREG-RG-20F-R18-01]|uniref:ShlB/FhaC/HecB family hemolysin secretion/activation protein n=1 Tax=Sphingomonas sp. TREG-RG-20F-R18-01 TaxID=2914982 RepID=UPI001F56AED1